LSVAPALGAVSGKVIANGAGVPGVRVAASDATGIANDWTMTDANGSYTLSHVLAGPMVIGAAKPGYLTD
jgi:hypothetical protein